MIYQYEIVLKFESNRKLTEREKDDLQALVALQALEPTSLDGEDEDYETSSVYVDLYREEEWKYDTVVQETTIEGESK